jgi:hypothetical protein
MDKTPADITRAAIDLIGREVTLHLHGDAEFGGVSVRFGTVVGLEGKDPGYVIVENYHDSSGYTVPRTLVGINEIIDIKAYYPGA